MLGGNILPKNYSKPKKEENSIEDVLSKKCRNSKVMGSKTKSPLCCRNHHSVSDAKIR